jgi:hypothetical protein
VSFLPGGSKLLRGERQRERERERKRERERERESYEQITARTGE